METLQRIFIPILLVAGGLLAFAFKCWFYGSDGLFIFGTTTLARFLLVLLKSK